MDGLYVHHGQRRLEKDLPRYRQVGQTVYFLVTENRDMAAAKRFLDNAVSELRA